MKCLRKIENACQDFTEKHLAGKRASWDRKWDKVKFADKNNFGILDHDITLPSGENFYNPMRVFPNSDGSELIFTLYQQLEMSDQMFAQDAEAVTKDLEKLKNLSENI